LFYLDVQTQEKYEKYLNRFQIHFTSLLRLLEDHVNCIEEKLGREIGKLKRLIEREIEQT